jgi:hypothetical protein
MRGQLLLSTYLDRDGGTFGRGSILRPDEGVILKPCS